MDNGGAACVDKNRYRWLKRITAFRIAWTRGNERTVGFNIETSEDNVTFTQRLSKSTSGTTEEFEDYDITDVNGRYVRINVLNKFAEKHGVDKGD